MLEYIAMVFKQGGFINMIGILIVTHQPLGSSFLDCIKHILGKLPSQLVNYTITPRANPDTEISNLQEILLKLDQGGGVLILTDLYGATPANIASKLIRCGQVECLSGLNLPMLLRAIQYQDKPLAEMMDKALSGGQTGIFHIPPPQELHADQNTHDT
ncbi:MAG: PTS fructose transporter subunit IIA [Nitrosomonas sp.]|nr:PTS fructose transporter subunit IIA [Nitrosomonas sp.]